MVLRCKYVFWKEIERFVVKKESYSCFVLKNKGYFYGFIVLWF